MKRGERKEGKKLESTLKSEVCSFLLFVVAKTNEESA